MIVSIIAGALITGIIMYNKLCHNAVTIEDEMKRVHIKKYCKKYVDNIINNPDVYAKHLFYWNDNKAQIKQEYSSFEQWLTDLAIRSYVNEYVD